MRRDQAARGHLIGDPARPVAWNIWDAFWEAPPTDRVLFAVCSGATLAMLSLTALGAVGLFDKN